MSSQKTNHSASARFRPTAESERRGSRRCKITQRVRVRPSDPERDHFDDVRDTVSVSRTGVYFHTTCESYELGMRLFTTLPYSDSPTAINREYLAEVVRLERLVSGLLGVGIKLLMEMGFQTPATSTSLQRK